MAEELEKEPILLTPQPFSFPHFSPVGTLGFLLPPPTAPAPSTSAEQGEVAANVFHAAWALFKAVILFQQKVHARAHPVVKIHLNRLWFIYCNQSSVKLELG